LIVSTVCDGRGGCAIAERERGNGGSSGRCGIELLDEPVEDGLEAGIMVFRVGADHLNLVEAVDDVHVDDGAPCRSGKALVLELGGHILVEAAAFVLLAAAAWAGIIASGLVAITVSPSTGRRARRGARPALQLLLCGGSLPQPQDAAVVPLPRRKAWLGAGAIAKLQ
jgi:hypothetical protein